MIFKKKEFFLLIFLILLQSCSGGRIGNFLESSFKDLEKISQYEDLKKNLANKGIVIKENKEIDDKKNKKIKKVEKPKNIPENKNDINLEKENKKFDDKKNKKIKKLERLKNVPENKNNIRQPIIKTTGMLSMRTLQYLMLHFLLLFSFFFEYF